MTIKPSIAIIGAIPLCFWNLCELVIEPTVFLHAHYKKC